MPWIPSLAETTKDWLQAVAWVAAAAGALLTAIKFWSELRLGREQRDRELRWKQAEAGKELNDEMQDDQFAWPALQMLDFSGRECELPSKNRISITHEDIRRSLDPGIRATEEKHVYIRDCFDSLFYYMAMFDHYIRSGLIHKDDVAYPIEYYVPLLASFRPQIDDYLQTFGLPRAQRYLERYPSWQNSAGISRT